MSICGPSKKPLINGKKIEGIQYLRALCALSVVVSHENGLMAFPEYFNHAPLNSLHVVSLFSVATFFSISGYIIVIASLDRMGQSDISLGNFLKRRAIRILPYLWACTLFYNALSWAGTGHLDAASATRTLLLWPVGDLKPNVAWSLRHEMAFYLIFAAAILWRGRNWFAIGIWLTMPLIAAPLIWNWNIVAQADGAPSYDLFKLLIAGGESGANVQFGVGLAVGLAWLRAEPVMARLPSIGLWFLIALYVTCCAIVHITDLPSGLNRILVWSALAGLLILAATRAQDNGTAGRVATALGNSSFSLYLMHNTVMLVALALSMKIGITLPDNMTAGCYLLFCVLISAAFCHWLYAYCEKPLIRFVKRRLDRDRGA